MAKSRIDRAIEDLIVIPMVALLGIYITALLLDSMLQINNVMFRVIFSGIGGVSFIIYYFKRKIPEYMG